MVDKSRVYFQATGSKILLPVGRDKHGVLALWDQHGVPTDDVSMAWTAIVLLPTDEWATIKCYEGQITEHTLH